jgi:hypothetical protein
MKPRKTSLRVSIAVLPLALLIVATPSWAGVSRCTGDCNDDKAVTVSELVKMVNIALGRASVDTCANGDGDGDGEIVIAELVRAVRHALEGCFGDIEPKPFKTRIEHPFDSYLAFSPTIGGPSWVKFTIRVSEPDVVYFQNSSQTPFHHDFVAATLEPYIGWTAAEIDRVSLYADGQELVFGAVLYSPTAPYEIAIQLVRQDAYSVEQVVTYFDAVRASVDAAQGVPFFYFPTFEQQQSAEENSAALEAAGIRLGSTARWLAGDVCYNFGWAHGRVVYVDAEDIEDAYESGDLGPDDILLTNGIPAEIPFVSGVLSLAPSTPNSHVAILAADWEVPFAFLALEETVATAQALVGREVVLRATKLSPRFFTGEDVDPEVCQVRMVDVSGSLEPEVATYLRDLKRAPDLAIRPIEAAGGYVAEIATATPDDIATIGGKAANYGFLLREIPDNSRPAMAFTFDLWNDYLEQTVAGGVTLRERIAEMLAPFPSYPPASFADLFDTLDDIRDLIDDETDFTSDQRAAVLAALQPRFEPTRQIRFRSSTNVEDSELFTGAGLYESKSGCLADDLDDDDEGPSICEPEEEEDERGVFRALRKVFASFYNDNAFLERLRHRVDESSVGMAVLVHYSFPDETELANGVAALRTIAPGSTEITIVTQPGAFSVTNPEDGGLPEVVEVFITPTSTFPNLRQGTDRLPLGSTVLQMPAEYRELTELLRAAGEAFGAFYGETRYDVEFEFKKIVGEGLVVKQIRRIPGVTPGFDTTPVLIHAPTSLCTFQGEYGDVFANYRLKSRWQPVFASGPLDGPDAEVFTSADHTFVVGSEIAELTGPPSGWPQAAHAAFEPTDEGVLGFVESWSVGDGSTAREMKLRVLVPTGVGPAFLPIVFPEDLGFSLEAEYETPVAFLDFDATSQTRTAEDARLRRCLDERPLSELHLPVERSFSRDGVAIDADFYWPPFPTGAVAGYTAPLDRWIGTTLSGITGGTIQLGGYFSQTYRPEHHNFSENFIFDPHLEAEIDPAAIAELDQRGIQAVVIPQAFGQRPFFALTRQGTILELADLLDP